MDSFVEKMNGESFEDQDKDEEEEMEKVVSKKMMKFQLKFKDIPIISELIKGTLEFASIVQMVLDFEEKEVIKDTVEGRFGVEIKAVCGKILRLCR